MAAVAKKDLKQGELLDGEGGYTVFGRLVRSADSLAQAYLPMGLTGNARMTRSVAKDTLITYEDVVLDESLLSFKLRKLMEKGVDG